MTIIKTKRTRAISHTENEADKHNERYVIVLEEARINKRKKIGRK